MTLTLIFRLTFRILHFFSLILSRWYSCLSVFFSETVQVNSKRLFHNECRKNIDVERYIFNMYKDGCKRQQTASDAHVYTKDRSGEMYEVGISGVKHFHALHVLPLPWARRKWQGLGEVGGLYSVDLWPVVLLLVCDDGGLKWALPSMLICSLFSWKRTVKTASEHALKYCFVSLWYYENMGLLPAQ